MSFEAERLAIVSFFDAKWASWSGNPKVIYDNIRFTPTSGETYLRFSIQSTGSRVAGHGVLPVYRWYGLIVISIFVPENTGTKSTLEWLDIIAEIFRNQQTGTITFSASYQPSIEKNIGGWYKRNIAIPFWRDGTS